MATKAKRGQRAGGGDRRINDQITVPQVRLISSEGEQVGVVATDEALAQAEEEGLDLVEIDGNAEPPVCRAMDYGKFKFEQSKKQQAARKKQKQIQVKEVKLRPGTDEGDFQVKLRNLRRFLEDGDKAKVTIRFRGREMAHQELGKRLLDRVEQELEDVAVVDQRPRMEGRLMVMMMSPRKGK
ncbi:translation initiation factor IF-3 [Halorhodospira halochloris]|nr:translation initiation factor IF-3 [Halorhodospira halochloris]